MAKRIAILGTWTIYEGWMKIIRVKVQIDAEQILCVTNLSRFAQPVDLDLAEFAGMVPVEMLGYVEFPPITRQPYRLTLGPYGFFWLELHGTPERTQVPVEAATSMESSLKTANGWAGLIPQLETTVLPAYLPRQRWFGAKSRQHQRRKRTRIEPGDVEDPHALERAILGRGSSHGRQPLVTFTTRICNYSRRIMVDLFPDTGQLFSYPGN